MDRKKSTRFVFWFIIAITAVTLILGGLYFCIEKSTESIDKDKWQNLLVSIEGFALAILLGLYTAIRMERTEKYHIEDKLTERYVEALRNLYNTEKEELQLLGARELYNVYQELKHRVSDDFRNQLEEKILNSIFEYLREVGVRETDSNGFSKDKVANKIFDLFLTSKIEFREDYRVNLKGGAELQVDFSKNKAENKIFDLFLTSKIKFPKDYRANLKGAKLQGDFRKNKAANKTFNLLLTSKIEFPKDYRANLKGANLQGANLQGAQLQNADLQCTKLEDTDLQKADLQGANLQHADLEGAYLQDANLQGANLQGSNLKGEKLDRTQLQNAKLQSEDLIYAYLTTDLTEAIVYEFSSIHGEPSIERIKHLRNIYSTIQSN